jgi:NTE family protein
MEAHDVLAALSPVAGEAEEKLEEGVALCLSGGGYRAMLFHVGALLRLNQLGYLGRLDRVSSVSGGSIIAGMLGLRWSNLAFDANGVAGNFDEQVVRPIRALADKTIDQGAVLGGILTPTKSIADMVAAAYRKHLFEDATLQRLPDRPRFVINSTNLQTGVLWRFSKPYMADYTIGVIDDPRIELAVAVAASSAFPPVLSPMHISIDPASYSEKGRGANFREPFTSTLVLSDGGVYDNLGLETAWKRYTTILVSDGGGRMAPEAKVASDWPRQAIRVTSVIDNQVRNLRKRQIIAGFQRQDRSGTYWGIRSHVADYGPPPGALDCPPQKTAMLAATKTRLQAVDPVLQERLINWGYGICDTAIRRWVLPDAAAPAGFPYTASGLG